MERFDIFQHLMTITIIVIDIYMEEFSPLNGNLTTLMTDLLLPLRSVGKL